MLVNELRDLTRQEYELFRRMVYENSGINLGAEKIQLVRARLGKIVRARGFGSYRAYYEHIKKDGSGQELCGLLDAISTNTTHLFREKNHFDFLGKTLQGWTENDDHCARNSLIRIWSAGCSSGEEPHTIAITAAEALRAHPEVTVKILATDLSTRMLRRAQEARYHPDRLGTVPQELQRRYFRKASRNGEPCLELTPDLKRLITFARLNLMSERFPFRHEFHVIFCRNVMIYFDKPTQQTLVKRFVAHLRPGGFLLIGHSESLNSIDHALKYMKPTIYQKPV